MAERELGDDIIERAEARISELLSMGQFDQATFTELLMRILLELRKLNERTETEFKFSVN